MASIVVVGVDAPLLEGVAQALAAAGCPATVVGSLAEVRASPARAPLVLVVERELVLERGAQLPPLAAGGAALLFHGPDSAEARLPHRLQRAVLADVSLPLERHRLVTLVRSVVERQQATGRERDRRTPPEGCRPPLD